MLIFFQNKTLLSLLFSRIHEGCPCSLGSRLQTERIVRLLQTGHKPSALFRRNTSKFSSSYHFAAKVQSNPILLKSVGVMNRNP